MHEDNELVLDYNIKNVDDRKEEVGLIIEDANVDKSRWISRNGEDSEDVGGVDYQLEKLANYILRSSDVETCRDIDYSFYVDNRSFNDEYRYKKKGIKDSDRDFPISEDYVWRASLIDYTDEQAVNALRFGWEHSNVNISINDINISLTNLMDFCTYNYDKNSVEEKVIIKEMIEMIQSVVYKSVKDSLDKDIMICLFKGMNIAEVSKEISTPWSTVKDRIVKLEQEVIKLLRK